MKGKLSENLSAARNAGLRFPVCGVDGYGGEQDGDTVDFCMYECNSLKKADRMFDKPLPEDVHVHYAIYYPSDGWQFSLGIWASKAPIDWTWPQEGRR